MPLPTHLHRRILLSLALLAALTGMGPARAEKADRLKPINIVSDRGGTVDMVNQRTEFAGNVVLSKGSILLRAEHMDVRETSDGYHMAYASGETGKPISFRQVRDVPGESIEGTADRLEYDSRSDTVRFIGNAVVRRMQGRTVAAEVTGAIINYDNRSEIISLEAGPPSSNPAGRVRVMMMPQAASAAEPASAPALQLQSSPIPPTQRKPS